MEVVYLFCESAVIRIPFFDYDKKLFRLLISSGGGIWDKTRQEFVFNRAAGGGQYARGQFERGKFKQFFPDIPSVWIDENAPVPLDVSGFLERPWKKSVALSPKPVIGAQLPALPETDFSRLGQSPLPEKLGDCWRQKLENELRSRKYSPRTRYIYVYFNRLLCRTLQKVPEEIRHEDITIFLALVEKDKEYSAASINLAISAIKFFYKEIVGNEIIDEQHRPRRDGFLPQILSKEEIKEILIRESNPKHRLLLMLAYSSGLRVSEVVALKKEHIDLARKVVYVKLGKGRKDRYTILSEKAARFLTEYCALYDVKTWLFPGQPVTRHLSTRSAQHIFDKAVRRAEIRKKISIHGLRHTFATHLLESGTDIRYIQSLLGHANIRTTERYTVVARRKVLSIQSPLDSIL